MTGQLSLPELADAAPLLELWVAGVPVPQGSKVAQPIYRGSKAKGTRQFTGKVRIAEQQRAGLDVWRDAVTAAARLAWAGRPPLAMPLLSGMAFVLVPFKSTRAGEWPTGSRTGDLDKLVRAVGDALTQSGVYVDDRKVVGNLGWPLTGKRFAVAGEPTGCMIRLVAAPAVAPGPERRC